MTAKKTQKKKSKKPAPSLAIRTATYGAGSTQADVTNRLRKHVVDGTLTIAVENDALGGDPLHDVVKALCVSYSVNDGPVRDITVPEHGTLQLPPQE